MVGKTEIKYFSGCLRSAKTKVKSESEKNKHLTSPVRFCSNNYGMVSAHYLIYVLADVMSLIFIQFLRRRIQLDAY